MHALVIYMLQAGAPPPMQAALSANWRSGYHNMQMN